MNKHQHPTLKTDGRHKTLFVEFAAWNNSGIASDARSDAIWKHFVGERGRVGQSKGQPRPVAAWLHAQELGRFDRMAAT
ncbi:hypothetical protein HZ326_14630 [Fusarium oxysporum f. sp. albedinis]|nr:hypothetical protein HZ326_14630 [Fusarium oxysporum f. sp. albedinis]